MFHKLLKAFRFPSQKAKEQAADVFALNLRNLLLVPPLRNKTVLGLDPGYRHGCKVVVVDSVGSLLDSATIYPHSPQVWYQILDNIFIQLV